MKQAIKPKGHREGQDSSGKLFDTLCQKHGFTRDRQLADYFGLNRSAVSRVRNGAGPVSLSMKLAIIQKEGMTPDQIDRLIKQPRFKVQTGTSHAA